MRATVQQQLQLAKLERMECVECEECSVGHLLPGQQGKDEAAEAPKVH